MTELPDDSVVVFINKDAVRLDELFLNDNWYFVELFDPVYMIIAQGKNLNWLVKIHNTEKYCRREAENLNRLKKVDNVPKVLAVGFSSRFNYIIISKAIGTDLHEYLETVGNFSETDLKPIALQLLISIGKIHSQKVIHKDIKPENIIYDRSTGRITIIDFEGKETEEYRSPEQIVGKNITSKTDIWSIGVTLYKLLAGDTPFHNDRETLEKPLRFSKNWSENLKDFLGSLIERESLLRYSAKEAINHVWFHE